MRKCARPKGRANAMTVHLLTSAKKPLLDFVRQRLLPLEPCEVRTVLVPVAQETAEDVAQALSEICRANHMTMEELQPYYDDAFAAAVEYSILLAKVTKRIRESAVMDA